jgi:hypothetical protein
MKILKIAAYLVVFGISVMVVMVMLFLFIRNQPCRELKMFKYDPEFLASVELDYRNLNSLSTFSLNLLSFRTLAEIENVTSLNLNLLNYVPANYLLSVSNEKLYVGKNYRFYLEFLMDNNKIKNINLVCD